ncbi:succinate dehydrogenase flavoprotein subunit [Cupriavidus metallidurans]|jgi:succinate dehydrogenase / fumarate reductase flavoprotein subunit|uniref:Succinate dehydrogenase flavoprotein subunit n=1 Tax=Cupriavidus metallidurans (strain ATCC 43123 / DSM 2839 / NBRC 102507 / CH34) TaxID=266264 RepID=Q1LKG5_CUPMC|nr:succinate dehydrogenase flavoprotein subunit [Cupriavidus metallidurans]ABF09361.1 succinate dehydrogenase, flavoprotein subunit [Cupriavidus metallidurans CH34]AVA36551.1 succinate dehydrogenase flavoprotein subunit [Cupriavidus metallidurans]KWW37458.1 Succinate dehydrogenase flavoprotein subunit [Cupriavidus metallidurans]MDE4918884.1 succinate dehydrogenase flavoprotein subunit [Cupriavidus metallidurans]QGS29771.1 succinate dehydrogenase flavoprotein subunit [Cupriavidus metallidurans]
MVAVKTGLPRRKFDVVIVGAGGAGMRASLQLAEAGLNVAVLSKVFPTRSHTVAAQGGIGASLGNMSEDNWHYHFYDTIKGSDWLGDQDAIEFMCREAPKVVYELEHFGMPFDRNADGTIYQRPFGGHTANYGEKPVQRACAAADRTGHALLHTLYQRNVRAKTHFFVEWMALDLIRDEDGDVLGVTALEMETGEVYILEAKTTLFATGGAGRIYAASTNAFINTGDGLGMAARAGVPLEDMEFWQFHPTGVAGAGVLITEGVRGEGGILRNKDGERFMERYAPTLKDLAPRDFVSRSMDQEIKEGRGCGPNGDYVLLDLTHVGAETIMKRLPSIREIGMKFANVDAIKEPIPVVPTIHYQMGGIPTNFHGQVVVPKNGNPNEVVNGFYAIGECSCVSVHGANRLGTNSLLDLVVFGRAAGNHIVANAMKQKEHKPLPADAADRAMARLAKLQGTTSGEYTQDVANDIRRNMQSHAGVFRTQKLMDEGVERILEVAERANNIHLKDKSKVFNTALVEALEVSNLVEVAKATMISAAARKESRGAHAHSDFPNRDDENWLKHTLFYSEGNRLDYKPVKMQPLTVESVPPKARTF